MNHITQAWCCLNLNATYTLACAAPQQQTATSAMRSHAISLSLCTTVVGLAGLVRAAGWLPAALESRNAPATHTAVAARVASMEPLHDEPVLAGCRHSWILLPGIQQLEAQQEAVIQLDNELACLAFLPRVVLTVCLAACNALESHGRRHFGRNLFHTPMQVTIMDSWGETFLFLSFKICWHGHVQILSS